MKKKDFFLYQAGRTAILLGTVCGTLFLGDVSVNASENTTQEQIVSVMEVTLDGADRYQSEFYQEPKDYYPQVSVVEKESKKNVETDDVTSNQKADYIAFDYTEGVPEGVYQDLMEEENSQKQMTGEIVKETQQYFNPSNMSLEDYVVNALENYQAEIDVSAYNIPFQDADKVYFQILNNHPELFYVLNSLKISYQGNYTTSFKPIYLGTKEQVQEFKPVFETAVAKVVAQIDPSWNDEEKALFVHDYLAMECVYDYENFNNQTVSEISHTAYGALIHKVAVCDGYSEAFSYILSKVGIKCKVVSSESMAHAWNMIYLDGYWYHVDITWDDPAWDTTGRVLHENFLISDYAISNAKEPHYGWVSDVQATSEYYSQRFWKDVESAILYLDGYWYFSWFQDDHAELRRVTQLNWLCSEILYSTEGAWGSNFGFYEGCYMYLDKAVGKIYFNTQNEILRLNDDGSTTPVFTPEIPDGNLIYGFTIQDEKLYFAFQNSPNLFQQQQLYYYELPELRENDLEGIVALPLETTYDGTTKTFTIQGLLPGDQVSYVGYSGTFESQQPEMVNTGIYNITYMVRRIGYREYIGTATVTIERAIPDYQTNAPQMLTAKTGDTLGDLTLPSGYIWENVADVPLSVGMYECSLGYIPEDTENYKMITGIPVLVVVECTDHDYKVKEEVDSTYTKEGEMIYACTICGDTYTEKTQMKTIYEDFLEYGEVEDFTSNSLTFCWDSAGEGLQYRVVLYDDYSEEVDEITTNEEFYKFKRLDSGIEYWVEVTPFEVVDGEEKYLSKQITITGMTAPGRVAWKNIKKSGKSAAKLTWKKLEGASGYEIYMKAGKGKFKKIKTVKKGSTVTLKKNRLKPNKYQFKIRAYSKIDGEKVYGKYSKVKKFVVKK